MKYNKLFSLLLILTIFISVLSSFSVTAQGETVIQLYVSPEGKDENNGSFSAPFKTLEVARNAARKIDGQVVINLREGVYLIENTLELTSEDSNTVYRAYKDEKVIINGANILEPAEFKTIDAEKKALIID